MFCTSCGSKINEGQGFCTGCGKPVVANAIAEANVKFKNPFPKILMIIGYIFAAILLLVGITAAILSDNSGDAQLIANIINLLLGLAFMFDIVWVIAGIVFCCVYAANSSRYQGTKKIHYQSLALWNILSPIIVGAAIIFMYVVVTVISKTLTNS